VTTRQTILPPDRAEQPLERRRRDRHRFYVRPVKNSRPTGDRRALARHWNDRAAPRRFDLIV